MDCAYLMITPAYARQDHVQVLLSRPPNSPPPAIERMEKDPRIRKRPRVRGEKYMWCGRIWGNELVRHSIRGVSGRKKGGARSNPTEN
jgi:hypothetical protein